MKVRRSTEESSEIPIQRPANEFGESVAWTDKESVVVGRHIPTGTLEMRRIVF